MAYRCKISDDRYEAVKLFTAREHSPEEEKPDGTGRCMPTQRASAPNPTDGEDYSSKRNQRSTSIDFEQSGIIVRKSANHLSINGRRNRKQRRCGGKRKTDQ